MEINYLAVLVCAVLSLVLGMIWYGKALFGNVFAKAIGMDMNMPPELMKEKQKGMWKLLFGQFILTFFQAWVLSGYIYGWEEASGVENSLWIFGAFVMPTIAGQLMWSNHSKKNAWTLFWISFGYQLILFVLFGLILDMWR